jgi:hypothetical protein
MHPVRHRWEAGRHLLADRDVYERDRAAEVTARGRCYGGHWGRRSSGTSWCAT